MLLLPPAGGGASFFHPWFDDAPDHLELLSIQPAGRESRLGEPPLDSVASIARDIVDGLGDELSAPFAAVGYSMGAAIGFEIARLLESCAKRPYVGLVTLAMRAPSLPRVGPRVSELERFALLDWLCSLGGVSRELLASDELVDLVVPILRADFGALERYALPRRAALKIPLLTGAGDADPHAPSADVRAWSELTSGPHTHHEWPGGHFPNGATLGALRAVIWDWITESSKEF